MLTQPDLLKLNFPLLNAIFNHLVSTTSNGLSPLRRSGPWKIDCTMAISASLIFSTLNVVAPTC